MTCNLTHLSAQGYCAPRMRWEPGGPAAIGAALVPVTSFVYQNVGFTATVRASLLPDRKIWVEGQVEDSSSASAPSTWKSGPDCWSDLVVMVTR